MFDSLKKRLKEAVQKVAASIKETEKQEKKEEKIDEREHEFVDIFPEKTEEFRKAEEKELRKEEKILEKELIEKDIKEKMIEAELESAKQKAPQKDNRFMEEFEEKSKKLHEELKEEKIEEIVDRDEKETEKETEKKLEPKIREMEGEKKPGLFRRLFEKTLTRSDVEIVLKELRFALLENDVAIDVVEKISEDVAVDLLNRNVRRGKIEDEIKEALRHAMLDVMGQKKIDLEELVEKKSGPFTIIFLGFNGTGKTTSLAKFAKKFKKYNPVVAAADTFRAASIEQLEEHSRRVGFRLVKHQYGADSAAVIFDARKSAMAAGSKLVLADTAGRSHSNINLMDELKKVVRVNNPDLKILVLDSMTGNDIYEQSRLFNDAVGVDAIVLTKADVYDKGGAALSATYTIKKPIIYLGVGQEYDDLKEFKPEEIVDNLLK